MAFSSLEGVCDTSKSEKTANKQKFMRRDEGIPPYFIPILTGRRVADPCNYFFVYGSATLSAVKSPVHNERGVVFY